MRPSAARRGQQLGAEEFVGHLVGVQQPLAPADVLPVGAGAAVLVVELEADPGGQLFHRLVEGGVVQFLHEGDDVAVLAAAEAVVPCPPAGRTVKDGERSSWKGHRPLKDPSPAPLSVT